MSRQEAREHFPDADEALIEYTVASEVLINVLGPQWWKERLADGSESYFAKDRSDTLGRFVHQHRVVSLANGLLAGQGLPGFVDQLEKFRRRSLIGVLHEVGTAHLLATSGHKVEFVTETQVKGADYDLRVDGVVALEVKAKEDDAQYTATSLASTLSAARNQLPPDGPGVIALRIPDHWASNESFVNEAEGEFRRALRISRRTNAILVVWDRWLPSPPQGMVCVVQFRVFDNTDPRTPAPEVQPLVRALSLDAAAAAPVTGVISPR